MTSIKPPVFFEYPANDLYLYDVQFSVNAAADICNKLCYLHFTTPPVHWQHEGRFFSDICIILTGFEFIFFLFQLAPTKCADTRLYQCTYFTPSPTEV